MSYKVIDSVIRTWATKNNLTLYTTYRGTEVRSVDIIKGSTDKYQIWVDIPDCKTVDVHVWNYKRQRKDWTVVINELENTLNKAVKQVAMWHIRDKESNLKSKK